MKLGVGSDTIVAPIYGLNPDDVPNLMNLKAGSYSRSDSGYPGRINICHGSQCKRWFADLYRNGWGQRNPAGDGYHRGEGNQF